MATADQVKALVRSHADGDDDRFYSVAMQVAAHEAKAGHPQVAHEIRDLVEYWGKAAAKQSGRQLRPVPVTQPRGDLAGLSLPRIPTSARRPSGGGQRSACVERVVSSSASRTDC